MKKILLLSLLFASIILPACHEEKKEIEKEPRPVLDYATPIVLSRSEVEIVEIQNDFALNLYKNNNSGGNFAFSPLSASILMSAAANAATGEKQSEIINTLGFAGHDMDEVNALNKRLIGELQRVDANIDIRFANALWLDKGVVASEDFKAKTENSFGMECFSDDFNTPAFFNNVNSWVNEKTEGFIRKLDLRKYLIDPALFVSALYFNGNWKLKFDKALTEKREFYNYHSGLSMPETMLARDYSFSGVYDDNGASWISLALGNYGYDFMLVLPDENIDLMEYFDKLQTEDFRELTNTLHYGRCKGTVQLPKFNMEGIIDLGVALHQMGMTKVFSENVKYSSTGELVKFTEIPSNNFSMAGLSQSIYFAIDEDGAAAATATFNGGTAYFPLRSNEIIVNRPFAFLIKEHSTGTIVLMGRVTKL